MNDEIKFFSDINLEDNKIKNLHDISFTNDFVSINGTNTLSIKSNESTSSISAKEIKIFNKIKFYWDDTLKSLVFEKVDEDETT